MNLFRRGLWLALTILCLFVSAPAQATVNTSASSAVVLGNGSNTQFTFSFIGVAAQYISVIYTDASGNQTALVQGSGTTQYTITLNPPVTGAIWGVGGTVTYNPNGSPIASGTTLTIQRTLPYTQAVALRNQPSVAVLGVGAETADDTIEMQLQQVNTATARSIQANPANTVTPLPLPAAAQMANKGLCGDSTGNNVVACAIPSSGVISSAMQPVVNAATLAAGRTAFGLGSMAVEGIGCGLADDGAGNARIAIPITQDSTNQSANSSFCYTQRIATGPITYTLARANTLFNGFGFWVYAVSGTVTLAPNASDNFVNQASGASLTILGGTSVFISTDAASSGKWVIQYLPQVSPQFQAQLTLSAGSLLLSRSNGLNLFIAGVNVEIPASGPTLAVSGLSSSTLYYIYAAISGSALIIEASATAYATDTTYGHKIKSGDPTRTLVGMAYVNSGGVFADSATQRLVRSYYSDPGYALLNAFTANRSTSSATFIELNTEIRLQFLVWTGETVQTQANGTVLGGSSGEPTTSIGFDGITPSDTYMISAVSAGSNFPYGFSVSANGSGLSEGFHYATLLGREANSSGPDSWVGSGSAGSRSTLRGFLKR